MPRTKVPNSAQPDTGPRRTSGRSKTPVTHFRNLAHSPATPSSKKKPAAAPVLLDIEMSPVKTPNSASRTKRKRPPSGEDPSASSNNAGILATLKKSRTCRNAKSEAEENDADLPRHPITIESVEVLEGLQLKISNSSASSSSSDSKAGDSSADQDQIWLGVAEGTRSDQKPKGKVGLKNVLVIPNADGKSGGHLFDIQKQTSAKFKNDSYAYDFLERRKDPDLDEGVSSLLPDGKSYHFSTIANVGIFVEEEAFTAISIPAGMTTNGPSDGSSKAINLIPCHGLNHRDGLVPLKADDQKGTFARDHVKPFASIYKLINDLITKLNTDPEFRKEFESKPRQIDFFIKKCSVNGGTEQYYATGFFHSYFYNFWWNINLLCAPCNGGKSAKELHDLIDGMAHSKFYGPEVAECLKQAYDIEFFKLVGQISSGKQKPMGSEILKLYIDKNRAMLQQAGVLAKLDMILNELNIFANSHTQFNASKSTALAFATTTFEQMALDIKDLLFPAVAQSSNSVNHNLDATNTDEISDAPVARGVLTSLPISASASASSGLVTPRHSITISNVNSPFLASPLQGIKFTPPSTLDHPMAAASSSSPASAETKSGAQTTSATLQALLADGDVKKSFVDSVAQELLDDPNLQDLTAEELQELMDEALAKNADSVPLNDAFAEASKAAKFALSQQFTLLVKLHHKYHELQNEPNTANGAYAKSLLQTMQGMTSFMTVGNNAVAQHLEKSGQQLLSTSSSTPNKLAGHMSSFGLLSSPRAANEAPASPIRKAGLYAPDPAGFATPASSVVGGMTVKIPSPTRAVR